MNFHGSLRFDENIFFCLNEFSNINFTILMIFYFNRVYMYDSFGRYKYLEG